ncbi:MULTISPECIES: NADH-quinone oxidoreductase subunit NuoN [unclassified Neisseria]|uniref:NADH-quinone oxidoreductase subunit NuoN n=1 Tax=unclassified Neisseria TaxID=2623750 RepID=UPI002665671C|nr:MULTISPECIES: NADH-quinone oxidoreductase subunit NuoN [unclassified Neisseria]MDO1510674.1 NADH-quinone oxidoreductase subunit NuoN [Neisseria sp. MVDL19-042950]MDO1516964.1 NADH-quinone oxidoreductase subunit NuoN [Neisseria sp. MVDL18-041461]MDO1564326.1 NADH-quinone oxidoreductase subunit NuoN [Neisseria sp. MVDL20-010259]
MNWTDLNLIPAMPEIVLLSALFTVLLIDLWISDKNRYITHILSLLSLVAVAFTQWAVWVSGSMSAFSGMYIADGMSQLSKMVMYAALFALFVYSKPYNQVRNIFKGEFYTLSLFALTGMSVMVSAGHFLTAYIGLELLSLALYAMIALRRDSAEAAEAALKYFVLGALASGLLLYGISMVYGATGSLEFATVLANAYDGEANTWLLKLGLVFIVVAVAFKLGAVPFHMWVPDVYQGAPTSVAAFVGTAPKVAAVVFAFRILVTGLGTTAADWAPMLAILAVVSLVVGNLVAIMQTNIKRMLAYSTISHMGFILLAFMAGAIGFTAGLYYAITYVVMGLVGFGVLMLLSNEAHECEDINDLAGLNQRNAWYAFLMLLAMFSMAGIPPLMGFYAKFAVIKALLSQGYIWLSVFAVVMSLIGAFYYLRVVKVIYFDNANNHHPIGSNFATKVFLSLNAGLLLIWGVMPQSMMDWCLKALENTL